MKERVNPETGKPEVTITKADQELIAKARKLVRRIFLGCPAEIVYEVQGVTKDATQNDDESAAWAEQADNFLELVGWPKEAEKADS